jgi:ActR/RegA family two-component response regulator
VSAAGVEGTFDLTASRTRDVRVVVVDLDEHGVGVVRDLRTVFADLQLVGIGGDAHILASALRAGATTALPRSATAKQLARTVALLLAA